MARLAALAIQGVSHTFDSILASLCLAPLYLPMPSIHPTEVTPATYGGTRCSLWHASCRARALPPFALIVIHSCSLLSTLCVYVHHTSSLSLNSGGCGFTPRWAAPTTPMMILPPPTSVAITVPCGGRGLLRRHLLWTATFPYRSFGVC